MVWCILLLLLSLAQPVWADLSNRILWLKLDENTGTSLTDSAGSHTASVTGASWQTGANCKSGSCVQFNGTSTVITVNDANDLSATNGTSDTPFSFTGWMYLPSLAPVQLIYGKYGNCSAIEMILVIDSPGRLYAQFYTSNLADNISRSTPTSNVPTNTWVHFGVTYTGSELATGIALYINGTQVDDQTDNAAFTGTANTTCPLTLGARSNNAWFLSNGSRLDEVKTYTRALSQADIVEDMNESNPATTVRKRMIEY